GRSGSSHAYPLVVWTVVAKLGNETRAAHSNVREPVPRLGMDVNLAMRFAGDVVLVDAKHQMPVHRARVVALELFPREIPMSVKPVRVARRQQQLLRAISF